MQYNVELECEMSKSFFATKAAKSVSLDLDKKNKHKMSIDVDIKDSDKIGIIIGASGSGKTTLAKQIYGSDCFDFNLNDDLAIIDQFSDDTSYEDRIKALTGIGLTSIPCWLRPVKTLSNGQKERARCALLSMNASKTIPIDEWTSTVNREVAKAMSHNFQKFIRRSNKDAILVSCHYDIVEWINPDWVIDCNEKTFIRYDGKRKDKLEFSIKECSKKKWANFSKYHYLNENLPGRTVKTFGMYIGDKQIGFQCFAGYTYTKGSMMIHSNRTVIHPDYIGFGLGIKLINVSSKYMHDMGYDVRAKFVSPAIFKSMSKQTDWKYVKREKCSTKAKNNGKLTGHKDFDRIRKSKLNYVTYHHFRFRPDPQ